MMGLVVKATPRSCGRSIFVKPSITKGNVMKKLLLIALVAAMVAGTAEARHCGRRNSCAPKCEPVCEQRSSCIGAPRIVECTSSSNCVEGDKPELCYLVPAPRNIVKNTDVQTTITYSCACKPACAVDPTADQVEQLRASGAIPQTCN